MPAPPEPALVRAQLARVLASAVFREAPRMSRLLRFLVEETLAGRPERLKAYTLGVEVFDRPADFDPGTDSIVRVQCGQLRRRLARYRLELGGGDPLHITLPRGGYVPAFAAADGPSVAHTATGPATEPARTSVCVLPFTATGAQPADPHVADALTTELMASLARFHHLGVLARSAALALAAEPPSAHRPVAAFTVEGELRMHARRLEAIVQVAAAPGPTVIQVERMAREVDGAGPYAAADALALALAGRIGDRYGPIERHLAHDAAWQQRHAGSARAAVAAFYAYHDGHEARRLPALRAALETALVREPDASDAWAALSIARLDEHRFPRTTETDPAVLDAALHAARRAVACDAENAFAHQALAMAHFFRREFDDFHIAAPRAVALNPAHADVLADIGLCHCLHGEWSQGLPLVDRALAISPRSTGWYHLPRAMHHALQGDFAAALHAVKSWPMPGFVWYEAHTAWFLAELGRHAESQAALQQLRLLHPGFEPSLARQLERWCVCDAIASAALAGWRKAGLAIGEVRIQPFTRTRG